MTAILTTISGNTTADPELRFSPNGTPVVKFSVANNRRAMNSNNEWEEIGVDFVNCTAFNSLAENLADSLQKGSRVIVTGDFRSRTYEDRDGNKRTVWELICKDVGLSARFTAVTALAIDDPRDPEPVEETKPKPKARAKKPKTERYHNGKRVSDKSGY